MCDPVTLGLMAASAVASFAGNKISSDESAEQAASIARARNQELEKTLARNKQYSEDSRQIFDKRVNDIGTQASQDIAKQQADRTQNIEANIPVAASTEGMALPASAPKVVKSSLAQKLSDIFSESTDKAKNLGALTGFGSFFQDQAIKDASANRDVGVNADMISGNMRILPHLQDFRQIEKTKPSSGIGQMLSALGSMAGMAAGARGGLSIPGVGGGAEDAGGFLRPNLALLNPKTKMFGGGV